MTEGTRTRLTIFSGLVALAGVLFAAAVMAVEDGSAIGPHPKLPTPFATPSAVKFSKVIGWPEGRTPRAPDGFAVTLYAKGLDYPRWLYVLPNGDVLVAEARAKPKPTGKEDDERSHQKNVGHVQSASVGDSANRIILLRDANHDGVPEVQTTFLEHLNQPMGMLLLGNTFYVANTDAVVTFPYRTGETQLSAPGRKILDLPSGGWNYHWNRNIVANAQGTKIYVTVGSDSNVMEHGHPEREKRRANILESNPDGSGERVSANGLRNPQGMAFEPETGQLWTAVNERDDLGDELVPDYITSVKEGGFYGWPYSYYGQHEDPRRKGERPDLVA